MSALSFEEADTGTSVCLCSDLPAFLRNTQNVQCTIYIYSMYIYSCTVMYVCTHVCMHACMYISVCLSVYIHLYVLRRGFECKKCIYKKCCNIFASQLFDENTYVKHTLCQFLHRR